MARGRERQRELRRQQVRKAKRRRITKRARIAQAQKKK